MMQWCSTRGCKLLQLQHYHESLSELCSTLNWKNSPWKLSDSLKGAQNSITYLWKSQRISKMTTWRKCTNECSHKLMRIAHKESDHHLPCEWQWQATMNLSAPNDGCSYVYISLPNISGRPLYKICILSFCHICRGNRKIQLICAPALIIYSQQETFLTSVASLSLIFTPSWTMSADPIHQHQKLERCLVHW